MTFADFVRAAQFLGTPAYAAPEQRFGFASSKSDVFALGVILNELVTGSPVLRPAVLPNQVRIVVEYLTGQAPGQRPTAFEVVQIVDTAIREIDQAAKKTNQTSNECRAVRTRKPSDCRGCCPPVERGEEVGFWSRSVPGQSGEIRMTGSDECDPNPASAERPRSSSAGRLYPGITRVGHDPSHDPMQSSRAASRR